jgi:hypothetical protein
MRGPVALVDGDRQRIEGALGARKGLSALRVHDVFVRRVVTSIPGASTITGLTPPTVSSADYTVPESSARNSAG